MHPSAPFLFQALSGPHYYTWGDHGGILVAIAQGTETDQLKYVAGQGMASGARAGAGREGPAAGRTCPWQLSRSFSRYSTNEGETWKTFTFSEKPVFVYGLLTEPGEKSTIFTIFGSYKENGHSWLILQINTTDVLGKGTGDRAIADAGCAGGCAGYTLLSPR